MKGKMLRGVLALCVGIVAHSSAWVGEELVRDGGFDQVLEEWSVDSALGSWIPYQYPAGTISLDPNGVIFDGGAVVSQPLNVKGVAEETVYVSVDIGSDWGLLEGNTVGVQLEYLTTSGERRTVLALNPDNAGIPIGSSANFQTNYIFPADADRLVGVSIVKVTDQWGAIVDNVSVFSSSELVIGPVPALKSIAPKAVAHGGTLTMVGSNFGTVPGVVRVGGITNGVTVLTWADDVITAAIGVECLGGAVEVEVLGARTPEKPTLVISSPYFTLEVDADSEVALPGQTITIDLLASFMNGFTTGGGVTLEVPDYPGAAAFSSNPLTSGGGALFTFDTTGLSTGVHSIVVRGTEASSPIRECSFELDLRKVASCELPMAEVLFTSRDPQIAMLVITDTTGDELSYELPWPTWSSSNPSVIDVHQDAAIWGNLYILPHATGSATLQATLPNGAVHTFDVTADIPASPSIVQHYWQSTVMSNDPMETNELYCVASGPMSSYGWYTSGIYPLSRDSWWGTDNISHTSAFSLEPDATPGTYMISSSATVGGVSVSDGCLIQVVNNPATGLIEGRVAQFGGDFGHGASGFMKFYDPATGALLLERQLWSHSSDYTLPSVPPGDYKICFLSDFGEEGWYPNADSNTAATVSIVAGETVSGINFTFAGDDVPADDPEIAEAPAFDAATGTFGFTIQSEFNTNYRFLKSTTLRKGSWYQLESLWGDGSAMRMEDTNTTSVGFYRVMVD